MRQSGIGVGGFVTLRLPAERFAEAFGVVHRGECGKVILDWT